MHTWMGVRTKITARKLESKTWLSDEENLKKIIDWAEFAGLSPTDASNASISNLRTIIKAAKKAVAKGDDDQLSKLFQLAAKLPTSDLRLKIGSKQRNIIEYEISKIDGNIHFNILLSPKQFKRIQESTKQYFLYKKINQSKEKDE